MAASSAQMNAAASAINPPRAQTKSIRKGVVTWRATTDGFMKIPDPIMPPITIIVASKRPRRRANPGAGGVVDVEEFLESIWIFLECGDLLPLWPSAARHPTQAARLGPRK